MLTQSAMRHALCDVGGHGCVMPATLAEDVAVLGLPGLAAVPLRLVDPGAVA